MKPFKVHITVLVGQIHKLRERGLSDEEIRKDPIVNIELDHIFKAACAVCKNADENRKKIAESQS